MKPSIRQPSKRVDRRAMIDLAKSVLSTESQAIVDLMPRLDEAFVDVVALLARCRGRVVICGMGKTGLIGRKIAATLASTGTPSLFLHSAEAVHGDLGQVTPKDVVVVISNSGETDETKRLLPLIKKIGCPMVAMTGRPQSTLARHSDFVINIAVKEEGCPLGLAPMASTTAALAMGDALAACLIVKKGFRPEDFAFFHPAGSLGKRLLLKVEDIMRKEDAFAKVTGPTPVEEALVAITRARCGCAVIVDENGRLMGIFTDGDLRRHLKTGVSFLKNPILSVMTPNPLSIRPDQLAAEAFALLKEKKVDELVVTDPEEVVLGLVDVQDLLKAGLV